MDYTDVGHDKDASVVIWSVTSNLEWQEFIQSDKISGHSSVWPDKDGEWVATGRIDKGSKMGSISLGHVGDGTNLKILNMCVDKYPEIKWYIWCGALTHGCSISKAYAEFEGKI
jgi:hypothetical protein